MASNGLIKTDIDKSIFFFVKAFNEEYVMLRVISGTSSSN